MDVHGKLQDEALQLESINTIVVVSDVSGNESRTQQQVKTDCQQPVPKIMEAELFEFSQARRPSDFDSH